MRDGKPASTVEASQLVPGDIIELKVGDSVPADARMIEAVNLEADEALLTGESVPVRKDPEEVYDDELLGPGDRLNVVFSSSIITKGRGRAIVFATGMFTEIGAIAAALGDQGGKKRVVKRDANGRANLRSYLNFAGGKIWDYVGEFLGLTVGTPLQRKLSQLFHYIFLFAVICAVIVLGANEVSRAQSVREDAQLTMFTSSEPATMSSSTPLPLLSAHSPSRSSLCSPLPWPREPRLWCNAMSWFGT